MNAENVVSFVKTYTATDWRSRKSSQKKKGITRISKINSQSKQKYEVMDPRFVGINNENENLSNRKLDFQQKQQTATKQQYEKAPQPISKMAIDKEIIRIQVRNTETPGLVESHYINCQQDVQQWLKLKQKLEERVSDLQLENSFLKKNVDIQMQYIQKIQVQVDILRSKNALQTVQVSVQAQQQKLQILRERHPSPYLKSIDIQCNLQQKEFQMFNKFSEEVKEQTQQFEDIIKQLENDKLCLESINSQLLLKIDLIESKLNQQYLSRQQIKNNLANELLDLINSECNLKMNLHSFQEAKDRIRKEMMEQNKILQAQRQLRFQMQRQKEELLLIQNKKIMEMQLKYKQYRQELDNILSFLERKDQMLTERERKIEKDQFNSNYYSVRQIPNEVQTHSLQLLKNEYEERINNITRCMQDYLQQLKNYRHSNTTERKQIEQQKGEATERINNDIWERKQKEISQDMGYLLIKVSSLEQLAANMKKELDQKQKQIFQNHNLLNAQHFKIQNLQEQCLTIQSQLRKSLNQCNQFQIRFSNLKEQRQNLESRLYNLQTQKLAFEVQAEKYFQQYQRQREELVASNIACQKKIMQLQLQSSEQKRFISLLKEQSDKRIAQLQAQLRQQKMLFNLLKQQNNKKIAQLQAQSREDKMLISLLKEQSMKKIAQLQAQSREQKMAINLMKEQNTKKIAQLQAQSREQKKLINLLKEQNLKKFTETQAQSKEQQFHTNILREQNTKNIAQIQYLKKQIERKVFQINQMKRYVLAAQNEKTKTQYQYQKLNDQLNTLQVQNKAKSSSIQSLRTELFNISHQYEQIARAHSFAKKENLKLLQLNIQLKEKNEEIQREIELIMRSHGQQIKNMQDHLLKLQRNLEQQRQGIQNEKKEMEKKIEMVKKDYDVLYNKYLKYKNIALQRQPACT